MVELVFEPCVVPVASTSFLPGMVGIWAEGLGLSEIAQDPETPLNSLINRSEFGGDELAEFAGRHCYRSFSSGRSPEAYIDNLLSSGHGSVLEHASLSFAISGVSRSLTHELVRHRAGVAVSQESQRYVEAKDIRFVVPPALIPVFDKDLIARAEYEQQCEGALRNYSIRQSWAVAEGQEAGLEGYELRKFANQTARSALPSDAETRLVWTVNLREARHVLSLRGSSAADAEIRRLVIGLLPWFKTYAPLIFKDFEEVEGVITSEYGSV